MQESAESLQIVQIVNGQKFIPDFSNIVKANRRRTDTLLDTRWWVQQIFLKVGFSPSAE